jgi:branched-chain amino acid transport system ATP-binding protein
MTLPDDENSGMATLVVEDVTKDFVGLRALDSVSLKLEPREVLGLIGPNGSGKTTLINVVTGFLKPNGGRIRVNEVDITGWSPHEIAPLGLSRTFQTARLFPALTVIENVEVAPVSMGMSRREARRLAYETLERFSIAQRADMRPAQLPYSELRRTEIARAVATNPNFLLLDEPAAGLNEVESEELLEMLAQILQEQGCSTLVVDHNMSLIMPLCDRLHVLNQGETICEGEPEKVRRDPAVIEAYLGASEQESNRASS